MLPVSYRTRLHSLHGSIMSEQSRNDYTYGVYPYNNMVVVFRNSVVSKDI